MGPLRLKIEKLSIPPAVYLVIESTVKALTGVLHWKYLSNIACKRQYRSLKGLVLLNTIVSSDSILYIKTPVTALKIYIKCICLAYDVAPITLEQLPIF